MKRVALLPVLLLAFLLSSVGSLTPISYAHTLKPMVTNCTGGCYSWFAWDGTTYGGYASLEMAGSGMQFHTSTAYFQRWAGFWGHSDGVDGYGAIHVGEEVDQPYSGVCGFGNPYSKGQYFYVQAWDTNNRVINTLCQDMRSGNVNQPSAVQVHPYVSNGGGMLVEIFGYDGEYVEDHIPYADGVLHSFASMGMQEEIFDNVSGHEVWGAYNTSWQYFRSNGTYALQTRNADILVPSNPPQMYWIRPPSITPGGQGITCDYDGGQACTHNG